MAKKADRSGTPIQVYIDAQSRARLEAQAQQTGRTISAEVMHAIERHLAAPPVLVTPPLADLEPAPKRGRPAKAKE